MLNPPNAPLLGQRSPSGGLGALLRHWRGMRGKSQLDLSLDTGVSQRHISFVESGRSVPSRRTLMDLAQALDVPLRERNALLLAAGYAPLYPDDPLDAAQMRGIAAALRRMLRQHEPFPAVVMDRDWTVMMANDAAPRFFGQFIDMAAHKPPRNLLHLMFDPNGMRPFIAEWDRVAQALLARIQREATGHVADDHTRDLLTALHAYPGVRPAPSSPVGLDAILPVIPLGFIRGDVVLNYFSMVSTVGTPQSITAQELRIECMFPADEATEDRHRAMMMGDGAAPPVAHDR